MVNFTIRVYKVSMLFKQTFKKFFFFHFEWFALATGLLLMALLDPLSTAPSVCPLDLLNVEFCPGEGLGRSISYGFRGNFTASMQAHPAGLAAIIIISGRIITIICRNWHLTKQQNYGKSI